MKKLSDQECRGEIMRLNITFNILDQNKSKFNKYLWPRFELNVLEY